VALLAWPGISAAASVEDPAAGYRLAGTLAVGDEYIAFLQVPDAGQVLVRAGSVVSGAKVLGVTRSEIRLALSSGVVDLTLDGTVHEVSKSRSPAVIDQEDDDRNRIYSRTVSAEQAGRELASRSTGPPGSAAADSTAAQRIAAVLDLPVGSRILKVQDQPVSSASDAIEQLKRSMAESRGVVTLDLKTPNGPGRVYLMPPKP
jgi:hypothetical protein